jgi:hypothetical protein
MPAISVKNFPKIGKGQSDFSDWPLFNAGNDLLSHTLSRAVTSAQRGLTSVFGMGTGGTPAVRSPTTWSRQSSAVSRQQTLLWRLIPPMRGKLVKERIYEV